MLQEVIDLSTESQELLWKEVAMALRVIQKTFTVDKLNVSAIGNIVSACQSILELYEQHVVALILTDVSAKSNAHVYGSMSTLTRHGCPLTGEQITLCPRSLIWTEGLISQLTKRFSSRKSKLKWNIPMTV